MTDLTKEKCLRVIEMIPTTSKGLRFLCKEVGVSYTTFKEFLQENEDYAAQYARAKSEQMDFYNDETIEIADGVDNKGKDSLTKVQRDRLRIDARKWVMSKLAPKKYGDKINVEHSGEVGIDLSKVSDEKIDDLLKDAGIE